MDRSRTKEISARGATERSESRKRKSSTQSPVNNKPDQNKKKPKTNEREVNQLKITSFQTESCSSDRSDESRPTSQKAIADETNMATAVSKEQFAELMNEFKKMNTKMDEINAKLDTRIETVEGKVFDLEQKHDSIQTEVQSVKKKLEENTETTDSGTYVAKLALAHAERNEQYQRNYNIRIFNLPENANETIAECETKVLNLFSEKLNVKIPIEAIDNLHRLGPKKSTQQTSKSTEENTGTPTTETKENSKDTERNSKDTETNEMESSTATPTPENEREKIVSKEGSNEKIRPVIVSFISRRIRREVLANRNKLKKTPGQRSAPIIITEDLTKQNHYLFNKARENKDKFANVWSKDGIILGKQHNGIIIRIDSLNDVNSPPAMEKKTNRRKFFPPRGFPRGRSRGYPPFKGRPRGYPSQRPTFDDVMQASPTQGGVSTYNPYSLFQDTMDFNEDTSWN